MAAAGVITAKVNQTITATPAHVHQAINGKNTVKEALDDSGILAGVDAALVAETYAVLEYLSPAHNHTILEALDNAIQAGQTAQVAWEVQEVASVEVTNPAGGVKVTVRTPMPPA
jgi:ABC-type metal ion transport system substrate-binding protein